MILDNCDIGRRAKIRRAVLDKNVRVPEDAEIGYDLERDRVNHHVTETGLVVVGGTERRCKSRIWWSELDAETRVSVTVQDFLAPLRLCVR